MVRARWHHRLWRGPHRHHSRGGEQDAAVRHLVTFRYRNRELRVPVIDRGPFVAGRDYDLSYATKLALGAGDLTLLWANH